MTRKLVAVGLTAAVAGGAWFYSTRAEQTTPEVRTAAVSRGSVVASVSATGTTEAVTSVTVGSQVSGTVVWLGADFNAVVKKGQVIARLDPSVLSAQVEQARANLTRASADLQQRKVNLADKQTKLERVLKLNERQLVSATEVGDAMLAVDVAKTDLVSAEAQVSQANASLNQARVNLTHATITAPIDGTVIGRSVDVGQTVAASLSSPTLFLIAADLAKMRASLSVDESDVSKIAAGQPVTITVSAYPGERFRGEVAEVRLQPVVASNVTSYTTIVNVANTDLKLKPGMTASAEIEVARRDDVLRVPNAALRFAPTAEQTVALGLTTPESSTSATPMASLPGETTTVNGVRVVLASAPAPATARATTTGARRPTTSAKAGTLWLVDEGTLRRVEVSVGLANTMFTEVSIDLSTAEDALAPGALVVTSVSTGAALATAQATTGVSSVFTSGGNGPGRGGFR